MWRWLIATLLALIAYGAAIATIHPVLYLYGRTLPGVTGYGPQGIPRQFGGSPLVVVAWDIVWVALWWAAWLLFRRSLMRRATTGYRAPLAVAAVAYFLWLPLAAWIVWRELFVRF